jgi:hypothetical protein
MLAGKQGSNQIIALLVGNDAYLIFVKKVLASKGEMHAVLPRLQIPVSESQRAVCSTQSPQASRQKTRQSPKNEIVPLERDRVRHPTP